MSSVVGGFVTAVANVANEAFEEDLQDSQVSWHGFSHPTGRSLCRHGTASATQLKPQAVQLGLTGDSCIGRAKLLCKRLL